MKTKGAEEVPAQKDDDKGNERIRGALPSSSDRAMYPDTLALGSYTTPTSDLSDPTNPAAVKREETKREKEQRERERCFFDATFTGKRRNSEREGKRVLLFHSGSESYITCASTVQYRLTIDWIFVQTQLCSRNESIIFDPARVR